MKSLTVISSIGKILASKLNIIGIKTE